jgi:hypothetical protein
MKLPRTGAGALRALLDEAEAMVIEAPDAEIIAETRGCWQAGAMADKARGVVSGALRVDRAPAVPRHVLPAWRRPERHDRD